MAQSLLLTKKMGFIAEYYLTKTQFCHVIALMQQLKMYMLQPNVKLLLKNNKKVFLFHLNSIFVIRLKHTQLTN
jgi:hypothetical protein